MTLLVSYIVDGPPEAWQRAKVNRTVRRDKSTGRVIAGGIHHSTNEKTLGARTKHRIAIERTMAGNKPFGIPLAVGITFCLPMPVGWSIARRREAVLGKMVPSGKPDLDNLVKLVLDCGNKAVWDDDAQITALHVMKVYSETPRTVVTVSMVLKGDMPTWEKSEIGAPE